MYLVSPLIKLVESPRFYPVRWSTVHDYIIKQIRQLKVNIIYSFV
jgi:hypothetical protein